jgi:hypothetical protein
VSFDGPDRPSGGDGFGGGLGDAEDTESFGAGGFEIFDAEACAIFVDFDNLFYGLLNGLYGRNFKRTLEESLNLLAAVRAELTRRDTTIVLGRAYSAFDEFPGSEAAHPLALMGYDPQYVVQKKGKNSADLQLSLDLMEVLLTRNDIDQFVIVGGDRDFIPVARKVLEARRELLIVALPEITSGDLIDRVGPQRFVDAGQFVSVPELPVLEGDEIAGSELAPSTSEEETPAQTIEKEEQRAVTSDREKSKGARVLGHIDLGTTKWRPLSDEEALSEERQARCLRLLWQIARRFQARGNSEGENSDAGGEVWLSPFLKNEMVDAFPHLTHPQRRRLVNLLRDKSWILVEERQSQTGPFPYSVVLINGENSEVRQLLDLSEPAE